MNIIFDFDGTIADSFSLFAQFLAEEADKLPLNDAHLEKLSGLSLLATARKLGHGWWRLPGLYYEGKRWMAPRVGELAPFKGVPEVVSKLHHDGYKLFIVSSNSHKNIEKFLRREGIFEDFAAIYGDVGFGGKARILKKVLRKYRLKPADTVYVGDEPRDIRAAHQTGLKAVAVSWGYSYSEKLKMHEPDALAKHPRALPRVLKKL
jgi:phosphoglycolate phosphatase